MKTNNLIKLTKMVGKFENGVTWKQTGTETVLLNPAKIIKVERKTGLLLLNEKENYTCITFSEALVNSYNVTETIEEIYKLANGI